MLSDFDKEIVPVFFSLSHSVDAGVYTTPREESEKGTKRKEEDIDWVSLELGYNLPISFF